MAAVEAEAQAVLPGRAGVGRQRTAAPGCLPAAGKVTRLPRGELERAGGSRRPRRPRSETARASAGLLHLDRRQPRRPAEKRPFRTRSRRRSNPRPERGQPTEARSRLSCQRPGGSATASGPRTAASSSPSSTTQHAKDDAAAPGHVCPGIRIHAIDIVQPPASASCPSPTWTRTRQSLPPRCSEEQRRDAKKHLLGRSLGNHAS